MATTLALVNDEVNKILNAATGTGAGATYAMLNSPVGGVVFSDFAWQTVVAGTFTGISVKIEGSLDGVNWTTVDTSTQVAGELRWVTGKPCVFLRANVGTFTGGTSVTVLLAVGT